VLGPEEGPGRITLIEVQGWEWIALALLGKGPHWEQLVYDRDRNAPMAVRNDDSRNPSLFVKPPEEIRAFLEERGVQCAAVQSERAQRAMSDLGWKKASEGLYTIFVRPFD
ncbi:MAG TPA: hypothetical protein PK360_07145, partial [bacterium]|nr:hypothetical protein [bacterium]